MSNKDKKSSKKPNKSLTNTENNFTIDFNDIKPNKKMLTNIFKIFKEVHNDDDEDDDEYNFNNFRVDLTIRNNDYKILYEKKNKKGKDNVKENYWYTCRHDYSKKWHKASESNIINELELYIKDTYETDGSESFSSDSDDNQNSSDESGSGSDLEEYIKRTTLKSKDIKNYVDSSSDSEND